MAPRRRKEGKLAAKNPVVPLFLAGKFLYNKDSSDKDSSKKEGNRMEMLIAAVQAHMQEIMLGIQFLLLLLFCIMAHKITVTKRKMDAISKAVEEYLTAVMEEEAKEEAMSENIKNFEENAINLKRQKAEEENRLISAVLQEIFP